jgi:SH3-like domain-containing protein
MVTEELGEWKEIRIASGSEGWVRASDLKKI